RGIFQGIVIFALALIIGVNLKFEVFDVIGVFLIVVLLAMCFSSLSMVLASFFRTRDRMMGIGQAITMPLFFESRAIYPVALMPSWLRDISYVNPLSCVVDALRSLLLPGYQADLPVDILAMLIATV